MGRESQKTKDKKMKRKQEKLSVSLAQALVDKANELEDPMVELPVFKKFNRNGLNLTIEAVKVSTLDKETKQWAFDLTKKNMQKHYEEAESVTIQHGSIGGWNDQEKQEEMWAEWSWFLLARDETKKPVAVVHFRFDMDWDDEVLYCYEIQLLKEVRRKGLGKFLMQILEMMAFKTSMHKVLLTVFKSNAESMTFFKDKLKYSIDETSPQESVAEQIFDDYTYEILGKIIKKRPEPAGGCCNGDHGVNGHSH